jgi:hypothetical protein
MSDSIDTTTEIAANTAIPPSANLKAGDDGPITGWDETIEAVAAEASTGSAEGEVVGFQPSALLSAQVITKPNPHAMSTYNQDTLPPTMNAASLPGAFFFLTLKLKGGEVKQMVAYDPYVTANSKRPDIFAYYEAHGLPYFENFDKTATGKWEYNTNYYCKRPNKGFVTI